MKKNIKTKEIALCGLLTSIMFIVGFIVTTFSNITGKSILQFSDIIYLSLFSIVNPFTLISSASLSSIFIDLYSEGLVFIPISIIVKILIGITFLFFKKLTKQYIALFVSYLWIFLYILYVYLLFDSSAAYLEFIIDCIQYIVTTIFTFIFLITYNIKKIKT